MLNKIISVYIISFLLLNAAKAQQLSIGAKGGVNISNLHFSNNTSVESKAGFNIGLLAHIYASSKWALQPELIYSLEGAKQILNGGDNKIVYNLNYLNVPVLLQYMFANGFRIEGGPQLGFLLSANTNIGGTPTNTNNFQTVTVSIPLGASYITSSGLGFDARYVAGLSNINNPSNNTVIQSNVFQFGIFYQFKNTKGYHHK